MKCPNCDSEMSRWSTRSQSGEYTYGCETCGYREQRNEIEECS